MKRRSLRRPLFAISVAALGATAGCNVLLGLGDYKDACPEVEEGKDCPDAGLCTPGEKKTGCYEGPDGTLDVGICHAGVQTCGSNGLFGPCEMQQVPEKEVCGNATDDDCNGKVDDCGPCVPGKKYDCYDGMPQSTEGKGNCHGGKQLCLDDGTSRGPCMDEVLPKSEDYDKKGDENCDGIPSADTAWVMQLAAPAGFASVTAAAADDEGNAYVAGYFSGSSAQLDKQMLTATGEGGAFLAMVASDEKIGFVLPGVGLTTQLRVSPTTKHAIRFQEAQNAVIVDEVKPSGAAGWSASCTFPGNPNLPLGLMAIDESERLLIGGPLTATMTCGSKVVTSGGASNLALIHFDQNHFADWSQTMTEVNRFTAIESAGNGDFWLLAQITGFVTFGTHIIGNSASDTGIALVRYDSSGNAKLAKYYGDDALPLGMTVGADGTVYVALYNRGTITLGGVDFNGAGKNLAIAAFDQAGGSLWGSEFTAPSGTVADAPVPMGVEPNGDLVFAVNVRGTVNFGGSNFLTDSATYVALVTLTPQAPPEPPKLRWVKYYGGDKSDSDAAVYPNALALAARKDAKPRDIVLVGNYDKATDFGTGTIDQDSTLSSGFVLRVAP